MNDKLKGAVDALDELNLRSLYAYVTKQFRERGYTRTRNLTGELGERMAFKVYNETKGLPKLQAAPENTKNVDALSRGGERYAVKTISQRTVNTGIFGGLSGSREEEPKQAFDYVIIVVLNQEYNPDLIVELDWEHFMEHKRWYRGMKGWGLTVGKKLLADAKIIYDSGHDRSNGWRMHLYS